MQPEAGQPQAEPGKQDYWQQPEDHLSVPPVSANESAQPADDAPLAWQASEAIHHEKNALWFASLIAITVILLALSIFAVKSWTFAALIVVMAVAVVIIGSRPPRVMQYKLSHEGLQVNDRLFSLHDFRAFGVLQDGPLYSIVLIPHKRFMPGVNVYFADEQGEEIVDMFGSVLPMEHVEPDFIDKISRKLHF